jgi:PAP2 superfamily protein
VAQLARRPSESLLHQLACSPAAPVAGIHGHSCRDLALGLVVPERVCTARSGRIHEPDGSDAIDARRLGGLVAVALRQVLRVRWTLAMCLYPTLTALIVLVTANHWVADVVAGAAIVLVVDAMSHLLSRPTRRVWVSRTAQVTAAMARPTVNDSRR